MTLDELEKQLSLCYLIDKPREADLVLKLITLARAAKVYVDHSRDAYNCGFKDTVYEVFGDD